MHGWHKLKPYLFQSFFLLWLVSYFFKLIFYPYQTLPLIWSSYSWEVSLKSKAKNEILLICKCEFFYHHSLWNKTQLISLIPFYCHLLLLTTSAIFWYYKYNSWPWVLWVWWGGYGSGCDPIWCCALYCDLGIFFFFFVCVVVDLKPTVSSTEPVRKLEGKQRLKTRWLSVDGSWHTPTPDEIGLSHGLTLNPSPTDPWIPLYTF